MGEGVGCGVPIENIDFREIDLRVHGTSASIRLGECMVEARRRIGERVDGGMRENERKSIGANNEGGRRAEWRSTPNNCEESMRINSGINAEEKDDLLLGVDS